MKISIEVNPYDSASIQQAIAFLYDLPDYEDVTVPAPAQPPVIAAVVAPVAPVIPTEQEAIVAMQGLVRRHGADGFSKAIEVLKAFGAARVTELKPEQREAFIAQADAA